MASHLSRKLAGAIFSRYGGNSLVSNPFPAAAFYTKSLSSVESESNSELGLESPHIPAESESDFESGLESPHILPESSQGPKRPYTDQPIEYGLDRGIYKAILVGQVGQPPIQKKLRSGNVVTLISLGTGGVRNNRKPLDNEEPKDYANRCAVQWHRVSVYPQRLGELAMKNLLPGSVLYVEGNIETKIYNDPITGLVRRIREVAIRRNGRLLFLGKGAEAEAPARADATRIGYY